ncbi:MAG: ABC transporter ATP-binding protein [Betaproteobacteria bacterium]|nr:ABC transporter ATP-binding protein [Betaproteobacteria bacterium]
MSLLEVRDLGKSFGGVRAVNGVSFSLERGELLALIGPNGAGKSTCFNLINGQLTPHAGSVLLDGVPVSRQPPRAIWRMGVGRTFQITATFGSMTVRENVQMVLHSAARNLFNVWSRAAASFRQEAGELLAQVGMSEQAERPCNLLAYGDLKRVELAMAVAHEPKLLLMDEPTTGMSPQERHDLMVLTVRLVRTRNMGVLFTEHSMDVVFTHASRIVVMARGQIIAQGSPAEVQSNAEVRTLYLGSGAGLEKTVP